MAKKKVGDGEVEAVTSDVGASTTTVTTEVVEHEGVECVKATMEDGTVQYHSL